MFLPVIVDVIAEKKHEVWGRARGVGSKKEPGSGIQRERDSPGRG